MSPMLDAQPNLNDGALPMRTPTIIRAALAALTLTAAAGAQQPAVPPGTLPLNGLQPGARDAFFAGLDARHNLVNLTAVEHFNRALQADSTFGLARIYRWDMAAATTVATFNAEAERATREGANRPVGEASFINGIRVAGINAERLLATVHATYPNDRRIALEYAWSLVGQEWLDTLRALVTRYPDWVPARTYLVFALTNNGYIRSDAERYEGLVQAEAAVRVDPRSASAHAILGHALHRVGRYDEAAGHLQAATKMEPRLEYAYQLGAEIAARDGKPRNVDRARALLDSALAVNPSFTRRLAQQRDRAFLLYWDGRKAEGQKELEAVGKAYVDAGNMGAAATLYTQIAALQAGCGDSTGVDKWIMDAKRLAPNANLTVNNIQAYGTAHMGPQARRELTDYQRRAATAITGGADSLGATYRSDLHRLTGMTLIAEGNAAGGLAELKRADTWANTYVPLAMSDAYAMLGNKAESASWLAQLANDRRFAVSGVSSAIAQCKSLKKR